jgi:transposase InsO family protein
MGIRESKPTFRFTLPRSWPSKVRSAMLHVVSLAQYAVISTRSWAADSSNARVRLKAENHRLQEEVAKLRAEMGIKDARMKSLSPSRRPYYSPTARLEILELRAARGWSLAQTAEAFLVCPKTVASWMRRTEEEGPNAIVQLRVPVNKFPDFVRYAVQRLSALCPTLGKKKLAEVLARAGLHLGTSTIGRIRKENPAPVPTMPVATAAKNGTVTARCPNHVWHIDLTIIPSQVGFWCSWLPFARPQCWPFCWWLALVLDQYSRRVMGFALFRQPPTSREVRAVLGRTIQTAGMAPRHLISDKGSQFWPTPRYKRWCRQHNIRPRFGAIGKHGSIAVLERAIRTIKDGLNRIVVPTRRVAMIREMNGLIGWINQHRPHSSLGGKTPDEVYFRRFPAHRRPRIEPRPNWPRASPCAKPQVLVAGNPGARFHIEVEHLHGHSHLPVVTLRRAA